MADKNIKIGVQVTDGGSAGQTTKNVKNVKDILDQTTASANNATKAISAMNAAQAGGRATTAKIKQATGGDSGDERGMYAAQRGAIGTGAAGRDFSKESQGLGGLVRLYATFAANIYAVGAAFNALSQAMDTTNMVKGLDQLGAAQGRNLGSLAKQLVTATDGAISLRDALTATAQASSSGMSNAGILKLGEVAKKASQALGVAMPDAISRLSRGITKIEPELLDELGIFVKIDKATEDYARTVGKSVSTLTDFERRQAFANAVLEEGARKFAAINIDTNPYEKIAATFQNLIQSGLELVNKVLTPITSLFASSPTALGVAIALFAKSLAGQALPFLSRWKTGLAESAEAARQNVIATNKARQSLIGDIDDKAITDAVASKKAALDRVDAGVARLQKVKGFAKTAALIPAGGLDDESVKALEARSKAINDSYTKGQALTEKTIAAKKREEAAINSVTAAYREQAAQEALLDKFEAERQTKLQRYFTINAANNRIADAAAAKSQRVNIVSSVAGEAPARGVVGSFEELNRQIALAKTGKNALGEPFEDGQKKMSMFNAGLTRTIGIATILGSAMGTLANSLQNLFIYVALAVGAFELLDKLFGTSAKESKAFGESMDTLGSSVENVNKTLENINSKKVSDFFSVESTQAKTNALADLSDSVSSSITKFQKLADAQSYWDKKWDSIFDFFGKGSGDKLADGLSQAIIAGISTIESPEAKAQFQAKIKEILNISDADLLNAKALDTALDKLTSDKKISAGKGIADAFKEVKENTAKSTNSLIGFRDALTEGTKLVDTMNASLKPTDNLGKIGDVLVNASFKLAASLKDPVNSFTAIKELVNNTKMLSLLPPEEGMRLASMRNELNKLDEDRATNEKQLQEAIKARTILEEKYNKVRDVKSAKDIEQKIRTEGTAGGASEEEIQQRLESARARAAVGRKGKQYTSLEADLRAIEKVQDAFQNRAENFEKERQRVVDQEQRLSIDTYRAGARLLEQSLKGAFAEAGIIVARGYLSLIAGAGGQTGVEEANLKQQEINIQIQSIKTVYENSLQLRRLTLAVEKDTNAREIDRLKLSEATAAFGGKFTSEDASRLKSLTLRQETIGIVQEKIGGAPITQGYQDSRRTDAKKPLTAQDLAEVELGSMKAEQVKMQGETAKLYAQIEAIDIDKKIVIPLRQAAKLEKERLEYAANAVTRKIEEEDRLISIVGVYNRELQARKDILAQDLLANKYAQDTKDLLTSQQILQDALATKKLDAVGTAAAERTINENNTRLTEIKLSFEDKLAKLKQSQFIQDLQKTEDLRKQEAARQGEILENSRQVQLSKLSIREAELSFLTATGRISEKAVANEQYQIALIKQQLDYERESLVLANAKLAIDSEQRVKQESLAQLPKTITRELDYGKTEQIVNPAYITAEKALTEETAKKNALLDSQKEKLEATNVARTRGLELTRAAQLETAATNKRLEEQATAMEKIQGAAQALGTVFGEFGKSLGTGLESILKASQDFTNKRTELDKKYSKDRLDLEKSQAEEIANIQDSEGFGVDVEEARLKAKQQQTKDSLKLEKDYNKKSTGLELDKNIAMASSAKSMFKEKTFAHKAFAAFEKVMMVLKLAMLAQEAAATIANAGVVIPLETAKAEASGLSAIMKAYNSLTFPFNLVAGALMAGIVASFIGKSLGGGGGSIPAGSTAEEKQEVQGTGQSYVNGKLVETGLGVLGDPTAKLETIANGIDKMEKHAVGNLEYSNRMLDALRSIRENTGSFVTTLIKSNITKKGEDPGKGVEVIDKSLLVVGTLQQVIDKTAQVNEKVTNKITDSANWLEKAFGGSDDVSISPDLKLFDNQQEIVDNLSLLFTNVAKTIQEGAGVLGIELKTGWTSILKIPAEFETSLLNKTPKEVAEILESQFGIVLSDFSAKLFPELVKFKQAGEDMGTTFLRLASDSQSLAAGFTSIGLTLPKIREETEGVTTAAQSLAIRTTAEAMMTAVTNLDAVKQKISDISKMGLDELSQYADFDSTKALKDAQDAIDSTSAAYADAMATYQYTMSRQTTRNIEAEQQIIKLNGGMDAFLERLNEYNKSILTAGDRTEIAARNYTALIAELDVDVPQNLTQLMASVTNKDQFQALYESATRAGNVELAAALFKLVPTFTAITEAAEKFNTALDDQKIKMGALGIAGGLTPDQAKTVQRDRERTKIREEYTPTQAAELITNQEAIWLKEDEIATTKRSITLLQAQGKAHDALIKSRQLELLGMDALTAANQIEINSITDANKTRDLEMELAVAQGNAQVALNHSRSKELAALSETDRAIKQATFDRQDANKTRDLEMDLARLQGNAQVALNHSRSKELDLLSAGDRAIKETIFAEQDRLDLRSREISLMNAQGYTYAALLETRELDMMTLTEEQKIRQRRLYQIEDQNKTDALNIKLLEVSGYGMEALYLRRVQELKAMSLTDQAIQRNIWLAEDANKTRDLEIELLEAQGGSVAALYLRREQELKNMSQTDQELKRRIWLLQDEKKVLAAKNAQEIKIYELLGNTSEVIRLQREAELEAMEEALRPGQRYIYALEDQKSIYEKLKTAISNTTSSLKSSIQTLKDYQASLKTGNKTILKPAEVYALKKQEFFNLKTIAEAVATTPAELAAQETAISKLPQAADSFLESSKALFASGQAYTDDFNLVDSILSSLTTALTGQLSDAEKSLAELKDANGFLETIDESTKNTSELMAELLTATNNLAAAQAAANAAGYTSAGGNDGNFNTGAAAGIPPVQAIPSTPTGTSIPSTQQPVAVADALTGLTEDKKTVLGWYDRHIYQIDKNPLDDIDPVSKMNALDYWAQGITQWGEEQTKLEFAKAVQLNYRGTPLYTAFARGGLASGLAMVGEEGPELVDFQTPGRVYPAGQTTAMLANNTALVNEVKALRQEVEKLRSEQKEQTGHLITTNYDATRIAAEMLAKATEESSKEMAWANRSAARIV